MKIGDLDALKKEIKDEFDLAIHNGDIMLMSKSGIVDRILAYIDNAPELGYEDGILSVESTTRRAIELEEAYNNGWSDGFSDCEGQDLEYQQMYISAIRHAIAKLQSLGESPQGEWIISEYVDTRRGFITKCPFCKTDTIGGGNFCPNCGAKMWKGDAE